MKLKLIAPKDTVNKDGLGWWNQDFWSLVTGRKMYGIARLNLPLIAGLTPPIAEITIIDENIEEINFDEKVDMVGISAYTALAVRAYQIADEFRRRGVKVVLGGIHPSVLPEEAIQHSDCVVIGEAENVWGGLINDFKEGNLKKFYHSEQKPDLKNQPIPRWDLLRNEYYSTPTIETTRGCPYDCEFCSIKIFLGNKIRSKPIESVIREVEMLKSMGRNLLFFGDDNLMANKRYLKELLIRLIPLKTTFQASLPISLAKEEGLMKLLAESGCKRIVIGLESLSEENLKQMNKDKSYGPEKYIEYINKIQSYGIEMYGSFIFGYDCDDEYVFEDMVRFFDESNISAGAFHILTPYPGTRLFERLKNENRILHQNWELYDSMHACFKPKLISPETLEKGFWWVQRQVFSYESIFKRLRNLWNLWNKTNVRQYDRISPIMINLNANNIAYSHLIINNIRINEEVTKNTKQYETVYEVEVKSSGIEDGM
ncbi:MAG: hypothetical protein AUJ85_00560 [Elusimicrobia bacterium CG1_02_37_114]|nr:MAG: hypothetical protein AUJ85_00560 [Elusimicrobia bacterium CG1_02_37_114]PIV52465.1 MAG: B12-binding domain-containing radical SAM protein [Elusimicrobia bacterium CG02_land_8_20_14_3_00_37_13]